MVNQHQDDGIGPQQNITLQMASLFFGLVSLSLKEHFLVPTSMIVEQFGGIHLME